MKKTIIKGITLTLFISLVGSFVLYRSGVFGNKSNSYSMSPNGSVINSKTTTSQTTKDSLEQERSFIPSSKSIIIKDFNLKDDPNQKDAMIEYFKKRGIYFNDSGKPITDSMIEKFGADYVIKSKSLMSSSKSGSVLEWVDLYKIIKDTVVVDSIQIKNDE